MKKYLTITDKQIENLSAGREVDIVIGKRVRRTLTTKSVLDIKKEELEAKYKVKLAKLEGENK